MLIILLFGTASKKRLESPQIGGQDSSNLEHGKKALRNTVNSFIVSLKAIVCVYLRLNSFLARYLSASIRKYSNIFLLLLLSELLTRLG